MRMKITMAKALQYATTFVDNGIGVWGCAHIIDGRVMATNKVSVISCKTDNGELYGNQLMPLSRRLKNEEPLLGEPTDIITRCRPDKGNASAIITLCDYNGLKKRLRLWKDVFALQKKFCNDKFHSTYFEITNNQLSVYPANSEDIGIRAVLSQKDDIFFGNTSGPHCFDADAWYKICNVLVDLNPTTVSIYFGKDSKSTLLLDADTDGCLEWCCATITKAGDR